MSNVDIWTCLLSACSSNLDSKSGVKFGFIKVHNIVNLKVFITTFKQLLEIQVYCCDATPSHLASGVSCVA